MRFPTQIQLNTVKVVKIGPESSVRFTELGARGLLEEILVNLGDDDGLGVFAVEAWGHDDLAADRLGVVEDQDIVVGLEPLRLVEHVLRADRSVGKVGGEEVEADLET